MAGQYRTGPPERAADDIAEIDQVGARHDGPGFQTCHVQEVGDEVIEPLGLFLNCADQFILRGLIERLAIAFQTRSRAKDGRERRSQIVGYRGQERGAELFRFRRNPCAVDVLHQVDALDGKSGLVGKRVEQAALIRRQQRSGFVAVQADDADGSAPRPHRQKQSFCARQRVGTAPGGRALVPGPFRSGQIRLVEDVFRRITRAHGHAFAFGQQKHDAHLEHMRNLIDRRP